MKRRAFIRGSVAAMLAATEPHLDRAARATTEEIDEASIIVPKPWPRPPSKKSFSMRGRFHLFLQWPL